MASRAPSHLDPVYGWMIGDLDVAIEAARIEMRAAGAVEGGGRLDALTVARATIKPVLCRFPALARPGNPSLRSVCFAGQGNGPKRRRQQTSVSQR